MTPANRRSVLLVLYGQVLAPVFLVAWKPAVVCTALLWTLRRLRVARLAGGA